MDPLSRHWEKIHGQFLAEWFEKEYPQALATASNEVQAAREAYGERHPAVLLALYDLSMAQQAATLTEPAEQTLSQAAQLLADLEGEAVRAPESPSTASLLIFLADRLWNILGDDEDQVMARYRRALTVREKHFGPDHPETADIVARLAEIDYLRGAFAAAEPQYRRALAIYEKSGELERAYALKSYQGLADTLARLNRRAESLPFFRQALALCEAQGCNKRLLYYVLLGLSEALGGMGETSESDALRVRADRLLPQNNPGAGGYNSAGENT